MIGVWFLAEMCVWGGGGGGGGGVDTDDPSLQFTTVTKNLDRGKKWPRGPIIAAKYGPLGQPLMRKTDRPFQKWPYIIRKRIYVKCQNDERSA